MWYFSALLRARHFKTSMFAVVCTFILLLLTSVVGMASTVTISDAANVLNASQVRSEAANLPYPIAIYTTNTFNGTTSAFDQQTRSYITSSNMLVMAIDTAHKHVTIVGGSSVRGSNSQYDAATQAFVSSYRSNNGDYTAATIAAIRSLRSNLGAGSSTSSGGGLFSGLLGTLLCIGLLVLIIGGVLFAVRRRRGFGSGRRAVPIGEPTMYNQPYNQYNQPYNQGYPPDYGGPYNQGQGMNPWVAGSLGAAAGGLVGYESGKERGEDQMPEQGGDWNGGNNNDFGGGSSADFGGGGSGADFGGGGGGDFGGGSSGSF